jgi:hypothetical protein
MHYIIESIFVALYSFSVAFLLSPILHNYTFLLFFTGFFKHFFGYMLGIHAYYCKHGYLCNKIKYKQLLNTQILNIQKTSNQLFQLIGESIIEGIIFVVFGKIISIFIRYKLFAIFIIGFILHILAEIVGIHSYFCSHRC